MSIINLPSLTLVAKPEHKGQDYLLTAEPTQPPRPQGSDERWVPGHYEGARWVRSHWELVEIRPVSDVRDDGTE